MKSGKMFLLAACLMFIFGMLACWDPIGDKEDDVREKQEAKTIGKTLSKTIISMTEKVAEGLASDEEGEEAAAKLAKIVADGIVFNNGVFSGTLTNPKGGNVAVEGSGSQKDDGSYQFEATLVFDAFAAGSIAFTGTIDVEFSGTLSDFSLTIKGSVDVSGDIETEAEVDLTISSAAGKVTVSGEVNGRKINESLN